MSALSTLPVSSAGLLALRCAHVTTALSAASAAALLPLVPGWTLADNKLCRDFAFRDYHHTLAFVNALAWVCHTEDHHPELLVTYNKCRVRYDTHTVQGLSINDFICAAHANALYAATTVTP
ncbi:MAG: 4a-hydroxytetrahydrobiopterin dehydratase [Sphingomonadaceae bacterium]